MLPRNVRAALITIASLLACNTAAADTSVPEQYNRAAIEAAQRARSDSTQYLERARKIADIRNEERFKSAEREALASYLKSQGLEGLASEANQANTPKNEERVVVFISSSIPMKTLQNMAADLEKVNGMMVIRGFIGGLKLAKPTFRWIKEIISVDPACLGKHCKVRRVPVVVDPMMFREFSVSKVPAVTIAKEMQAGDYCHEKEDHVSHKLGSVTYGDMSLYTHLSKAYQITNDSRYKDYAEKLTHRK